MTGGVPFRTAGAILLAFAIAAALVWLAGRLINSVLARLDVDAENRAAIDARGMRIKRALMLMAYAIAAAASISVGLERFGISEPQWNREAVARWFLRHGINIVIIAVGATIVVRVLHLAIEQLQFKIGRRHAKTDFEWQRRAATITGLLESLVSAAIGFVAVLMLLRELSLDVMPILTGAGIAGLAVGFGAQNLVRDVISGFFLILEDQVRVGDLVKINGVGGFVEQINLRTIVLRDGEGAVQVFPNGTVGTLANLSKHYAYAVVDVRVAYSENLDRVMATLDGIGGSLDGDPAWKPLLLAPMEIAGVESIADGFCLVRVRVRTPPLSQNKVANEVRRRVVTTFVAHGIRPYAG